MIRTQYRGRKRGLCLFVLSSALWLAAGNGQLFAEQTETEPYAAQTETEAPAYDSPDEFRLKVFGTSDVHGYMVGIDTPYDHRLAYIADKVNDARRAGGEYDPDRTVLVDAGDIYQGTVFSYLLEGECMSAAYDEMQYDAVTVGNHEFDWGIDTVIDDDATMRDYTLDGVSHENRIPVVCSNLYHNGEIAPFTRDFVILDKKAVSASGEEVPVRVAVVGFEEEYSGSLAPAVFTDLGYSIREDYKELNRLVSELEENRACDATILLSHCDAGKLFEALGDDTCIDLVIGGHTHKDKMFVTDGGIAYLEPYGNASTYMFADLVFEKDESGAVHIKSGADEKAGYFSLYDLEDSAFYDTPENAEELDPEVVALVNSYIERLRPVFDQELGYVTTTVNRDYLEGSGSRASTVGNFMAEAMMAAAKADVGFINKSGLRRSFIVEEGKDRYVVTVGEMFAMCPFDNLLYVYEMTYGELLDVLVYANTPGGRSMFTRMAGIDCWYVDDPARTEIGEDGKERADGWLVDALEKDGELIYKDGVWADGWEEKKVKVATSQFVATSDRESDGLNNPLCAYNDTDRLLANDVLLRDAAIDALRREGEENDGNLFVDTHTYYHYGAYDKSSGT